MKVFIVAEIGSNWEGDIKKAFQLIEKFYKNETLENFTSDIMIFNKFNCLYEQ